MNTISPPPEIRRISAGKRVLGVVMGIAGGLGANALLGYGVMSFYTRSTKFVPYDTNSPDHSTPTFRAHNPASNPPGCIDHAVKEVPYAKLPAKYRMKDSVDQAQLATDFCRGVWGGVAYRVQRRYLERKYRNLPGREGQLWDVKDLEKSQYEVGTVITDHFEVVEHTKDKVGYLLSGEICAGANDGIGHSEMRRFTLDDGTKALGWLVLDGGFDGRREAIGDIPSEVELCEHDT